MRLGGRQGRGRRLHPVRDRVAEREVVALRAGVRAEHQCRASATPSELRLQTRSDLTRFQAGASFAVQHVARLEPATVRLRKASAQPWAESPWSRAPVAASAARAPLALAERGLHGRPRRPPARGAGAGRRGGGPRRRSRSRRCPRPGVGRRPLRRGRGPLRPARRPVQQRRHQRARPSRSRTSTSSVWRP